VVWIDGRALLRGAQADAPQSPGYDPEAQPGEGPVATVQVEGFWLQQSEVQNDAFRRCVEAGACATDDVLTKGGFATYGTEGGGTLPVTGVTFQGAQRFCHHVGGRLPTEDEWEWAARGPQGLRFPWGETPRCPASEPSIELPAHVMRACDPVIAKVSAWENDAIAQRIEGLVERLPPAELLAFCQAHAGDDEASFQGALTALSDDPSQGADPCKATPLQPADLFSQGHDKPVGLGGNVAEWTTAGSRPLKDGHASLRGGSFLSGEPLSYRSASRLVIPTSLQLPDVGFRCILPASSPIP